jgi:hypothetical protein
MKPYASNSEYLRDLVSWGRLLLSEKEEEAVAAAAAMEEKSAESLRTGMFLPLEYLFVVFKLNRFERHCVRMALLPELDTWFEEHFASLQGDSSKRLLSSGLAIRFYKGKEEDANRYHAYWNEESTLSRYFFRSARRGDCSDLSLIWKLDQRILNFVLEGRMDNPDLAGFSYLWEPVWPDVGNDAGNLEDKEASRGDKGLLTNKMLRLLQAAQETGERRVVFLLTGPAGVGKKQQLKLLCKELGRAILFIDIHKMIQQGRLSAEVMELLCREGIIRQAVLCFAGLDALLVQETEGEALAAAWLDKALAVSNLALATAQSDLQSVSVSFPGCVFTLALPIPDEAERLRLWREFSAGYNLAPELRFEEAAAKFVLSPGQIKNALAHAKSLSLVRGSDQIDEAVLYESCFRQIRHGLNNGKARKVPTVFTWDDLILPPASKSLLKTACDQVRYKHTVYNQWGFGAKLPYGRGLSLLFSGSPGTGKTMGAQVVAGELKLELYKVDLAGVVSKYIGETEKNLEEIFREAAKSQAVLFFDEADVLFNKRTEVKDALDKYSNMEAAFMLQKIEEYEGVCVLATNFLQNFDEAFKRRLKFIVEFPFPNREYRYKLWHSVFPSHTPLSKDLDYDYLARHFELSGSSIKNIAVNAAFIAASGSRQVGMKEILQALRQELAKSGKSLSSEELGEYQMFF